MAGRTRISASTRNLVSPTSPLTRCRQLSLPTCCSRHIHRCLILFSMKATNSRQNIKVALSSHSRVLEPTGYKVVRVPFKDGRPEGFYENFATGFWISGEHEQKCGDVPPRLRSPKADRCSSPMIRVAPSGAFPTRANAMAPRCVQME
jgi:hypothetical protein